MVIFMKIYFITKNKIIICLVIILAISIVLFLRNFFKVENCVAFNDGPTVSVTPKILDILYEFRNFYSLF